MAKCVYAFQAQMEGLAQSVPDQLVILSLIHQDNIILLPSTNPSKPQAGPWWLHFLGWALKTQATMPFLTSVLLEAAKKREDASTQRTIIPEETWLKGS